MQSSLNNQKHHSFNRSVLAHSEVTPAKKSRSGTITKFCSNQSQQGLQQDDTQYKEYRKQTEQLKEKAGQILYTPNAEKQEFRVCYCGKLRISEKMPVGVRYDSAKNGRAMTIFNIVAVFGRVRIALKKSVWPKKN